MKAAYWDSQWVAWKVVRLVGNWVVKLVLQMADSTDACWDGRLVEPTDKQMVVWTASMSETQRVEVKVRRSAEQTAHCSMECLSGDYWAGKKVDWKDASMAD